MPDPSPDIANRVAVMCEMSENAANRGEFFFYVRIPEPLLPLERGEKYEDPIDNALKKAGLGEVSGGGQQLGEGKTIVYCGIDVVLKERVRGMKALRQLLHECGAPPDTVIEEFLPQFHEHPLGALNPDE